ncbi:Ribosome maturation factor RimM [Candidatus Xenohaliotis californiensis]|uniref:Ribosome maturation factor RimM n=1 Tax=Candidatus Xenohaliotis californiensis TaxID=84677 RepID=A0ABP0EWZ6_9RICK|nr:Ribosome maturation factor RimM [Candidatus Xenohaliotis californiensis]
MDEDILIATVVAPHGVCGHVKLKCFLSNILDIKKYSLFDKDGFEYKASFKISLSSGKCTANFFGVNSYNAADKLRGLKLFTKKSNFPKLNNDEFYYRDMIGLLLLLSNGEIFGNIVNIGNFGAGEVVEIMRKDNNDIVMMPVIKSVFPEINIQQGYAIIRPMELFS